MSRAAAISLTPGPIALADLPVLRVISSRASTARATTNESRRVESTPLALTDDLRTEIEQESQRLETASAQAILQWVTGRFASKFTMATAFGPEGMVLIHMLAEIAPR